MKNSNKEDKLTDFEKEIVKKVNKKTGPNDMEKAVIARANMGQNANLIAAHFQMPVKQVKEILAKY